MQQKLLLFMLAFRQAWIPNIRGTFKTFRNCLMKAAELAVQSNYWYEMTKFCPHLNWWQLARTYSDSRNSSWNMRMHITSAKLPKRPGANRPDPVGAFCSECCEEIWQNIFWDCLKRSKTFLTRLGCGPSHIIIWPCPASDAWLSLLHSDRRNGVSASVNHSPDRRC